MRSDWAKRTAPRSFWLSMGTVTVAVVALLAGAWVGVVDQVFSGWPWWARALIGLTCGIGVVKFGEWVARRQWQEYWRALGRVVTTEYADELNSTLAEIRRDAAEQGLPPDHRGEQVNRSHRQKRRTSGQKTHPDRD